MFSLRLNLIVLILLLVSVGSAAAQVELFISVRDDCTQGPATDASLYSVNPNTGQAAPIGPIGFPGVSALAFMPDGRLLGTAINDTEETKSAVLIEINPDTGAGSLIGTIGEQGEGQCSRAPGLSVNPITGTLYATADGCTPGDDFLQIVNTNTGQGTLKGSYFPFDGGGNGFAISNDGVHYVTTCCISEPLDLANLITVDPITVTPTLIGDVDLGNQVYVNGLAFHPITGDLYGTSINQDESGPDEKSSQLIIIDTQTAVPTIIADLPDCTDGLVFRILPPSNVPTLSEWGLIAMAGILGLVGFIVIRKRKITA